MEASVLYVRANPPFRRPINWCVSKRMALALPSKCTKSSHRPPSARTRASSCRPAPSEENAEIARSPECPNGGLPMSCARQAAETIDPISCRLVASPPYFCIRRVAIFVPSDRPTHDTSKLCVSRLCTKMLPGRGKTCVLFCNRRKGEEKISRS